ncbi:MAG: transcription termination/antitermination protein NusA, partial [Gammaproteobacteria bacterium]|nr:transcription termination/antitermination protein NusA [Gammaproteobacteria bacterium]
EEVAYVAKEEFMAIDGFDEEIVDELRARARDALLASAITGESLGGSPSADLLAVEGVDPTIAGQLAAKGVCTADDLAELAVDELQGMIDMPEQTAASLIMNARQRWFEESE